MTDPAFDPGKVSLKDMQVFCAIHDELRRGSTEGFGELCRQQGVNEEFIGGLEHKLFGHRSRDRRLVYRPPDRGPTPLGDRVKEAFDAAWGAMKQLQQEGLVGHDRVRLQATRSVINTAVLDAYEMFCKLKRDKSQLLAEVVVTDGFSHDNKLAVWDGQCHFGVGYKPPERKIHLDWEEVLETELVLVCAKRHEGKTNHSEFLHTHKLLTLPDASVFSRDITNILPTHVKRRPREITLPGLNYVTEWVRKDLGVTFALKAFVPPDLHTISLPEKAIEHVYLYRRQDWKETYSEGARRFGECLITAFHNLAMQPKHGL